MNGTSSTGSNFYAQLESQVFVFNAAWLFWLTLVRQSGRVPDQLVMKIVKHRRTVLFVPTALLYC